MNNELLAMLEYIEQERGIKREVLVQALENAILSASHKSISPASELEVKINQQNGAIQAWAMLEVVEKDPTNDQIIIDKVKALFPDVKIGEKVKWEVTPSDFGRIAAQTAKQAIIQQLRRAEKDTVCAEFSDRVGQIIDGTVRRFEAGNLIIDFQKAEGILGSRERIHGEQYMPGDRINVLLLRVDPESSGPSLIVSRAHPDFIARLFEREVTEIHDNIVQIMGIAREAGNRTKIAVKSLDQRIDPVGACVGVRGNRVRNITAELGMERIDIVPYDEDICKYAANALQPAKTQSVESHPESRELIVHVTEEQSKLAFGKKAQNVRLCSKLVGWNVTIKTDNSMEDQLNAMSVSLAGALGVSEKTAGVLVRSGYNDIEGVKAAEREQLLSIEGVDVAELELALDNLANA